LLAQLTRLEEQMATRERNAKLLTELLNDIDGVRTLRRHPKATRHAYHLYMFALDSALADRVEKSDVIRKLNAEGIPVSAGYVSLNQNKAIIKETKKWLGEERVYSCPVSERACDKEILWLAQNVLLGSEEDMHDIAKAVRKVIASYR